MQAVVDLITRKPIVAHDLGRRKPGATRNVNGNARLSQPAPWWADLAAPCARHIMSLMPVSDWYTVERLPWPADWAALFGRAAPLVIEVGFGSGLFLAHLARTRPDANILGVEISVPALRNAARKIERGRLDNVRLLHAEATAVFQALCAPAGVDAAIINFPDPWPKKGHQARRLIDDEFLWLLATRLRPGATLDVATDHDDYAAQIADCLGRSPHFESRNGAPFVFENPDRVTTKYETVALTEGRRPRYFLWGRNDAPVANRFPIPQELPMPHVVLRGQPPLAEIGQRFAPRVFEFDGGHVRFVEAYQSLRDGKLLVETYISEPPVVQRLALEIRPRASGEVVIGLAEVGFPRPTPGVHHAIHCLVEWLREAYPATVVVNTTLQVGYADCAQ